MELQHIELIDLKTTAINVRKKGARDIADLVPSIKSLGILQPLLVRPNCEGFEIVAGQRRYHALLKIAEEEAIDPVPCIVMDSGDDAAKFWALQNPAIADAKTRYLDEGWADFIILELGERWCSWEFTATSKSKGGKVFVECSNQGEVHFHEGYLSEKEAKRRKQLEQRGEVSTKPKSELTKAMQNYLDLHRHAAVRSELLDHRGIALRLAVAQIIAGSNLWDVKAESQKANTDIIRDSLAVNKANDKFAMERSAVMDLLEFTEEDAQTIVPLKSDWARQPNLHAIFAKLITLDDETVTRILTFVVAETLPSSTALVEILGNMFGVDMADHWQPDDTFFDLLRDKQAINAMLHQVGGKNVAEGNIISTAKVQKKIIKDYLDGTRKSRKQDWQPNYMQFPMKTYTDKGGIAAVANWNEAKPYFN